MAIAYSAPEPSSADSIELNKRYLLTANVVAALGGLLFGFDTAVISGTIPFIEPYFNLTDVTLGWAVSSILLGCAIGAVISGRLSEHYGRKVTLIFCALLFSVTAVATGFSYRFDLFVAFRILGGVAVGMAAVISPMYISEISPAHVRGRLVSLYQLAITLGILLAFMSNFLLADSGADAWRWMFSVQAIPAMLFFVALFVVPESPRWLISKNRIEDARHVLTKIGGQVYGEKELASIRQSFNTHQEQVKLSVLLEKRYFLPVTLGVLVAVFSQVTGYNSLLYYAPLIFKNAGLETGDALFQTLAIGIINCVFTFVAIVTIDKVGRRLLLLSGSFLMTVCWALIAFTFNPNADGYLLLSIILIFCAVYAATIGPVTWTYIAEIFPNKIRALGISVATLSLWIACFVTSFTFPVLAKAAGESGTFLIYGGLCLIYFLFIFFRLPETKGKPLETLERELSGE
ncbi:MAG: sugar porter family MFS transporter [Cyclobacteriaceae bacterium]|nr:sugar porter family MFS transporter [Cyclobacteriaceae bacterium]